MDDSSTQTGCKIFEIVCGDSSTVVKSRGKTADSDCDDKIFGWGRGYSLERSLDVSRFKPKQLSAIETQHRFLVPFL